MRPMRTAQPKAEMAGEAFEVPRPTRRATASDYGQAYRELETGYDEPATSSRGIWLLASLLGLALAVAVGGAYLWTSKIKPPAQVTEQTDQPPIVSSPEGENKVPVALPEATDATTKKKIYDRIVGDREVLGNSLTPTEEVPMQPEQGSQGLVEESATGGGEATQEGQPLPMPPPPGENGAVGEQGALPTPPDPNLQSSEKSDPAAGASQAAVVPSAVPASSELSDKTDGTTNAAGALSATNLEDPGAVTPEAANAEPSGQLPEPTLTEQSGTSQQAGALAESNIGESDEPAPAVKSVQRQQRVVPKKPRVKAASSSLGSRPVVLVPARKAVQRNVSPARPVRRSNTSSGSNDGGLYGENFGGNNSAGDVYSAELGVDQNAPVKTVAAPKRRTLLGSFLNDNGGADDAVESNAVPATRPTLFNRQTARATETPSKSAEVSTGGTGSYVAQIASYVTQADASKAFGALKARHPELVSRYRPVISEATVGGSTRYRLALGPLASQSVANDVCARLIAAGERDCLAKRQ